MQKRKVTPITSKIEKRLYESNVPVRMGQKVLVTNSDGSQYIAEVIQIHGNVKNWILKVRKVNDDGSTSIEEVADLVVEAVIILRDIVLSEVFKAAWQWIKNLFKKRPQNNPSLS